MGKPQYLRGRCRRRSIALVLVVFVVILWLFDTENSRQGARAALNPAKSTIPPPPQSTLTGKHAALLKTALEVKRRAARELADATKTTDDLNAKLQAPLEQVPRAQQGSCEKLQAWMKLSPRAMLSTPLPWPRQRVPPIVWQAWINSENPAHDVSHAPEVAEAMASWVRHNQNQTCWKTVYWLTNDVAEFYDALGDPYNRTYHSLPFDIMRIDFVKYTVAWKFGGLSADLDAVCEAPLNWIPTYPSHLAIIAPENTQGAINAGTFLATQGHPLFEAVVEQVVELAAQHGSRRNSSIDVTVPHIVHAITGPGMFTDLIRDYLWSAVLEYLKELPKEQANRAREAGFVPENKMDVANFAGNVVYLRKRGVMLLPKGAFNYGEAGVGHIYGSQKWANVEGYVPWTLQIRKEVCPIKMKLLGLEQQTEVISGRFVLGSQFGLSQLWIRADQGSLVLSPSRSNATVFQMDKDGILWTEGRWLKAPKVEQHDYEMYLAGGDLYNAPRNMGQLTLELSNSVNREARFTGDHAFQFQKSAGGLLDGLVFSRTCQFLCASEGREGSRSFVYACMQNVDDMRLAALSSASRTEINHEASKRLGVDPDWLCSTEKKCKQNCGSFSSCNDGVYYCCDKATNCKDQHVCGSNSGLLDCACKLNPPNLKALQIKVHSQSI